jgi:hypothetical protein
MFESFDEEDLSMIEGETEMVVNKEVRKGSRLIFKKVYKIISIKMLKKFNEMTNRRR